MLTYPKQALENARNLVDENKLSEQWMLKHDYEVLIKLVDAVVYRNSKSMEYLLLHKHFVLAAFVNAVWEDKKALTLLLDKKEFIWAAMANYINGDKKAGEFLNNNNFPTYFSLAVKIQEKIQKLNDRNTNFFNSGPFKV